MRMSLPRLRRRWPAPPWLHPYNGPDPTGAVRVSTDYYLVLRTVYDDIRRSDRPEWAKREVLAALSEAEHDVLWERSKALLSRED